MIGLGVGGERPSLRLEMCAEHGDAQRGPAHITVDGGPATIMRDGAGWRGEHDGREAPKSSGARLMKEVGGISSRVPTRRQ
jgi:hypothetical protein